MASRFYAQGWTPQHLFAYRFLHRRHAVCRSAQARTRLFAAVRECLRPACIRRDALLRIARPQARKARVCCCMLPGAAQFDDVGEPALGRQLRFAHCRKYRRRIGLRGVRRHALLRTRGRFRRGHGCRRRRRLRSSFFAHLGNIGPAIGHCTASQCPCGSGGSRRGCRRCRSGSERGGFCCRRNSRLTHTGNGPTALSLRRRRARPMRTLLAFIFMLFACCLNRGWRVTRWSGAAGNSVV